MTTYTWTPASAVQFVDWNTPADWSPAATPDASTADVIIPVITTADGSSFDSIVTISGSESYVVQSLTLDQILSVEGTLAIAAELTMGAGGEIDLAGSLALGSLSNLAAIDIQGYGTISSAGSIENQGEMIGEGLVLDVASLDNLGTLFADPGDLVVNVVDAGGLANLSGGTLSGGTYDANGGTLDLAVGAAITNDAATIIINSAGSITHGTSSVIETTGGGTAAPLAQTLATIAPTGVFSLFYGSFADAVALSDAGLIDLAGTTLSTPALTVAPGGRIIGSGTIAAPISNDGSIVLRSTTAAIGTPPLSPTLDLTGSVTGSGTIAILSTGTVETAYGGSPRLSFPTLEIGAGNSNTVVFADANGTLILDRPEDFTGTLSGFTAGFDIYYPQLGFSPPGTVAVSDSIILTGLAASAVSDIAYSGTQAAGTLTFQDAGTAYALAFSGDYTESDFVFAAGPQALSSSPPSLQITETLPCFLAGTRLLTARGEVAVEDLVVGEPVRTARGDLVPVRWIGQRYVDAARHPRPRQVWPIQVSAHAFGMGRPHRDLLLSPDHAIFVEGVLIPVRHLRNGITIRRTRLSHAHYFHVELPQHDILLAEGLPAESYLDLGNRACFSNGGGAVLLHPDFGRRLWQRHGCAELILGGPVLARVRALLRVQARLLSGPRGLPQNGLHRQRHFY